MADEYVDLVKQLWDSMEPDSYVADQANNVLVDHTKVHEVGYKGEFHASRGPLNVIRSPQGNPVLGQAGASPRGRDFAAKYADLVLAVGSEVERMKDHRDDVRARAAKFGRNPDDLKVMYLVSPIVAATHDEAIAKRERWFSDELRIRKHLEFISAITEIDFAQFDLDEPLPTDLHTEGEQSMLRHFTRHGGTLRQMAIGAEDIGPLVGTPTEVADAMEEQMDAVGGDGFLIVTPKVYLDHEYIDDTLDLLVPELRARGLIRTEYTHAHLRENLREF
jgi:alkanesulfonate monooxygenase SsuD/methylene tetrahydromethanopterin reductase-like flavin-dependent oxidoreductase (luciferase family)